MKLRNMNLSWMRRIAFEKLFGLTLPSYFGVLDKFKIKGEALTTMSAGTVPLQIMPF